MTLPKISKNQIGFYPIVLVIIIVFVFVIGCSDNSTPGISLTKINESRVPTGEIIHLSDKDFEAFPQFVPIFHGTKQGDVVYANGTRIEYIIGLSFEEIPKFRGSILGQRGMNYTTGKNEIFYEYNGSYYYFGDIQIP
jgi:hypothetical protein